MDGDLKVVSRVLFPTGCVVKEAESHQHMKMTIFYISIGIFLCTVCCHGTPCSWCDLHCQVETLPILNHSALCNLCAPKSKHKKSLHSKNGNILKQPEARLPKYILKNRRQNVYVNTSTLWPANFQTCFQTSTAARSVKQKYMKTQ